MIIFNLYSSHFSILEYFLYYIFQLALKLFKNMKDLYQVRMSYDHLQFHRKPQLDYLLIIRMFSIILGCLKWAQLNLIFQRILLLEFL